MPLPPKLFYPICETASRWSVSPIDIVGWAIDGRITLSAALPLVEAKQGRPVEGLVEISGQEVFDLLDAGTNKKSTVRVQRFRRRPGARWEKIVTPADGVPLKPSGVIIARTEAERFEREHGIFGHHAENDQQPAKDLMTNLHSTIADPPLRQHFDARASGKCVGFSRQAADGGRDHALCRLHMH